MDSHGLESGAEGEVTLVDGGPVWRSDIGRELPVAAPAPRHEARRKSQYGLRAPEPDTQLDLRAVAASDEDDWDRMIADAQTRCGDVTDVDMPALPPVSDNTLPDQPLLADDVTDEVESTLLDTPTMMAPYLAPARTAAQTHRAPSAAERLPEAPAVTRPATPSSPAYPRPMPTPRTPRSTPGNGSKRLTRRSDREALARVIAMAKPRTGATRAQATPRPDRTR